MPVTQLILIKLLCLSAPLLKLLVKLLGTLMSMANWILALPLTPHILIIPH